MPRSPAKSFVFVTLAGNARFDQHPRDDRLLKNGKSREINRVKSGKGWVDGREAEREVGGGQRIREREKNERGRGKNERKE